MCAPLSRGLAIHERDRRDGRFEVLGSKFQKPRTSNFEPAPVSLLALVARHMDAIDSRRREQ